MLWGFCALTPIHRIYVIIPSSKVGTPLMFVEQTYEAFVQPRIAYYIIKTFGYNFGKCLLSLHLHLVRASPRQLSLCVDVVLFGS